MLKFFPLLFLILITGCFSSQNLVNTNFAGLYNKNNFHPNIKIFHINQDSSELLLQINTKELLTKNVDGKPEVKFKVFYSLVNSLDESTLIDSASFPVIKENTIGIVYKNFHFPCAVKNAEMLLEIKDLNKNADYQFVQKIEKIDIDGPQFFLTSDSNNFIPETVNSDSPFKIEHANPEVTELVAKCYFRKFDVADPPFAMDRVSSFDYAPDSIFNVKTKTDAVQLKKNGFCEFVTKLDNKNGLTVFKFSEDFPNVTTPTELIEPVRYLTTRKEYDELISKPKKQTIDQFWLSIGGDPERAKELIRKYYGRVVEANKLFSSFKEGWKTDRGMIYIIYGRPNIVYKTSNSESWVYGSDNSLASPSFTFVKVNNPFTDNDYTLSRSQMYQTNWFVATDTWRQGRAFNDFKDN